MTVNPFGDCSEHRDNACQTFDIGAALELLFGDKQKFPRQMCQAET